MRPATTEVQTDYHAEETAGYCSVCNRMVPRDEDANCAVAGHSPDRVTGLVPLDADGTVPFQLPRFNWAAALMPPVWGPIHGVLSAAIVLPLIVFASNSLENAFAMVEGGASVFWTIVIGLMTAGILGGTLYLMYYFGARGWGIAWKKSAISHSPEVTREMFDKFIFRERLWTLLSGLLFVGFVYLVINFWILP
ncbi:MAG: hypothetical protein FWE46_03870 [Coriobacteriia bacterium]|nr:hypothetical protein [Coriobacteriia bacterium]MCL2537425.1 hypothetical protein [Coriobacteriia bacterium]